MKKIRNLISLLLVAVLFASAIQLVGETTAYAASEGKWVLTEQNHFTPDTYVSRSNTYYKYRDSYMGIIDGNVTFKVSGGYDGPGDGSSCDMIHRCSQPKSEYALGETVSLTMSTVRENSVNVTFNTGKSMAKLCKENKELPKDGRSLFFENGIANPDFKTDSGKAYADENDAAVTMKADMPKSANEGERVAVVFFDNSGKDSVDAAYEAQYGGYQYYEWIYTYTTKQASTTGTQASSKTSETKADNPATVSVKTVKIKAKALKKKAATVKAKNAFAVSNAQGKVTYKKLSGNKKISISKSGKIKVKKKLKKGNYKIKVQVTAAGNDSYNAKSMTITVKIKIK